MSPASGDGPRRRGRGTLLAIAVSLLALTVAVAAVLVAWRALDQANDARDIAKAAGAGQGAPAVGQGTAQPTTEATPAQPPATDQPPTEQPVDPGATPEEPVLNEQTRYEQAYTKEALTLRPNSCRTTTVDLDEPRVRVDDNQAETEFNAECGTVPAYFSFPANVRVTQVDGVANLTPVDCGKRVRTGALNPDTRVPAKMGTMFCLVTSLASAVQSGIRQKMVVLRVAGISQDGTVSVEASAWHIPR